MIELERPVVAEDIIFFLRTIYKMRFDDAKSLTDRYVRALSARMGTEMPRLTAAWLWSLQMLDALKARKNAG